MNSTLFTLHTTPMPIPPVRWLHVIEAGDYIPVHLEAITDLTHGTSEPGWQVVPEDGPYGVLEHFAKIFGHCRPRTDTQRDYEYEAQTDLFEQSVDVEVRRGRLQGEHHWRDDLVPGRHGVLRWRLEEVAPFETERVVEEVGRLRQDAWDSGDPQAQILVAVGTLRCTVTCNPGEES